jgi:GNAT superfamily N-acetyltransferase
MATIKKAKLSDIGELSYLFDCYRVFYEHPSDREAAVLFLTERMEHGDSEIFVSVSEKDMLTGFVQLYPLFSSTRMKRLWLLNDLFVLPVHRGLGISKSLIGRAKELCRDTSAAGLILETAKSNTIGNQLYPQTGFSLDTGHNYYFWDC